MYRSSIRGRTLVHVSSLFSLDFLRCGLFHQALGSLCFCCDHGHIQAEVICPLCYFGASGKPGGVVASPTVALIDTADPLPLSHISHPIPC